MEGYDIDKYDESVLTGRSMAEIAGDAGSEKWKSSRPASRGAVKAAWLADAIAKFDKRKKKINHGGHRGHRETRIKKNEKDKTLADSANSANGKDNKTSSVSSCPPWLKIWRARSSAPCPPRSIPCWPLPSTNPSTIPSGCSKSSGTATARLPSSKKAKFAWCRAIRTT